MGNFLIVLGMALAGYALRSFAHPLWRRIGGLLYFGSAYVAGYFMSRSHWGGIAAVSVWFLIPLLEIVIRARKMRMPMDKEFRTRSAPSRDEFPHLPALTGELETSGFERVEDTGWDWQNMKQFVRVMANQELKMQATIQLDQQGRFALSFVSILSRTAAGFLYTTWNHPFSQSLTLPPEAKLQWLPGASSFQELLDAHKTFLLENGIDAGQLILPVDEQIAEMLSRDVRSRVDHNLSEGLLELSEEGLFRYSWRGCLFLWAQSVKDMLRLI